VCITCPRLTKGDHAKSVKDAIKAGIPVYSTSEVQLIHAKVKVPKMGEKTRIGGFLIQPLEVPHSCECFSYIITHEEFGKLLFFTDCSAFKYKVKNCNHILAECNYSEEILITKMCDNEMGRSLYGNHLELEDTVDALKANFCSATQSITLIHLSDSNSNKKEFVRRVKEELGFEAVYMAEKGLELEICKEEF
jgi:phosphoribosyl 1,2-cyclic phosphodiesterase